MRKGGVPVTKNMYTVAGDGPCNEELLCGYKPETKTPRGGSSHRTKVTSPNWRGRTRHGVNWRT